MAQHDYVIANASGAAVRADLNSALSAIVTNNSGATAPATTYAYQWWADTTTGLLKVRNAANSAWVTVGTLATANLGLVVAPAAAGTADQVLATNGSGVQSWSDRARLVRGTAVASTSGTSIDFTGIPSWVERVTVLFNAVSLSGTADLLVQIGISTGIVSTGYASSSSFAGTAVDAGAATSTTGFVVRAGLATAGIGGAMTLDNISGNIWVASLAGGRTDATASVVIAGGTKTLTDVLDRVRITTTNGTDTFDAGSLNIIYQG
jgi:hypothetical protein